MGIAKAGFLAFSTLLAQAGEVASQTPVSPNHIVIQGHSLTIGPIPFLSRLPGAPLRLSFYIPAQSILDARPDRDYLEVTVRFGKAKDLPCPSITVRQNALSAFGPIGPDLRINGLVRPYSGQAQHILKADCLSMNIPLPQTI